MAEKDIIQQIVEKIFGHLRGSVVKKLGLDNVLGNLLGQSYGGNPQAQQEGEEPGKLCDELYKGELPYGLFAFIEYWQSEDIHAADTAGVFAVSKSYSGDVAIYIDGLTETISIKPCSKAYFETKLPAKKGTIVEITAAGSKQKLTMNYSHAMAIDWGVGISAKSPVPAPAKGKSAEDNCDYINDSSMFSSGTGPAVIYGISRKDDAVYEPQNQDVVFFALLTGNALSLKDKQNPGVIKSGRLRTRKKIFSFRV